MRLRTTVAPWILQRSIRATQLLPKHLNHSENRYDVRRGFWRSNRTPRRGGSYGGAPSTLWRERERILAVSGGEVPAPCDPHRWRVCFSALFPKRGTSGHAFGGQGSPARPAVHDFLHKHTAGGD